jgi:hypothetical protein
VVTRGKLDLCNIPIHAGTQCTHLRSRALLDDWLPRFDVRDYHERAVEGDPAQAFAAFLETPAGCDRLTRALFSLRGLRGGNEPLGRVFAGLGFDVLERTDTSLVVGTTGRPWRPRGSLGSFGEDRPGTVRLAADLRARPGFLSTETRVQALDADARRAFRRYWLVVGPFSALIRRRWLLAASRAIADANRSTAPSPNPR